MADKKISELTAATTPLAGTEVLPIVQSSTTKKVAVSDLTAGRAVSATSIDVGAGAVGTPSITATGDTDTGVWFPGANTVAVSTAGTERLRFDANGNIGQNVTPSAWKSDYRSMQVGLAGSVVGRTATNQVYLGSNWFVNSSNQDIYLQNGAAAFYSQNAGAHAWFVSASGTAGGTISFTQAMQLSAASNLSVAGNVVIGTAGKGIDFSANTNAPGMTSELLSAYEEGTWTPNQGAAVTVVGAFTSSGTYTRVGRLVLIVGSMSGATSIAANAGNTLCTNLPFQPAANSAGSFTAVVTNGGQVIAAGGSSDLYIATVVNTTPNSIVFTVLYSV